MTHKVVYRSTGSTLVNFPGLAMLMLEADETESYAPMSDGVILTFTRLVFPSFLCRIGSFPCKGGDAFEGGLC